MNEGTPPKGLVIVHGSQSPPPDNTAVHAWYRAGRAFDETKRVESVLDQAIKRVEHDLGQRLRKLELANRQSGHDLREVKEWKEDSEVRDMRRELVEAKKVLAEQEAAKRASAKRASDRAWEIVKMLLAAVIGSMATWYLGQHPH